MRLAVCAKSLPSFINSSQMMLIFLLVKQQSRVSNEFTEYGCKDVKGNYANNANNNSYRNWQDIVYKSIARKTQLYVIEF